MLTIHPEFFRPNRPYRVMLHTDGNPENTPESVYYSTTQDNAEFVAETHWQEFEGLVRVLHGDEVLCEFES